MNIRKSLEDRKFQPSLRKQIKMGLQNSLNKIILGFSNCTSSSVFNRVPNVFILKGKRNVMTSTKSTFLLMLGSRQFNVLL